MNCRLALVAFAWIGLCAESTLASGIYRDGIGARAASLGGADVAWARGPLSAFGANPAGLAHLETSVAEFGVFGARAQGSFDNVFQDQTGLRDAQGLLPEVAFGTRFSQSRVRAGLAIAPEAALGGEWRFTDPPGGADGITTYGDQIHESRIGVLRAGGTIGVQLDEHWSVGASVSLIYNDNLLRAPYIFQTQPVLRGVKTLLDLDTDGFGWTTQLGVLWAPRTNLQFGLTYRPRSVVRSHGEASGNAGIQLANLGLGGAQPDFHYDAEVVNHFPQMASAGVSWQPQRRWRFAAQLDWADWSGAFDELHVILTRGNNPDLNALVGSDSMEDVIPLDWKDQFVFRTGVEFEVASGMHLRGGYVYGRSPVPSATLSPLTAAIFEHVVTAGFGWARGRWQIDAAYQRHLPHQQDVGTSALRSGEYSNTSTKVSAHWFGITTSLRF